MPSFALAASLNGVGHDRPGIMADATIPAEAGAKLSIGDALLGLAVGVDGCCSTMFGHDVWAGAQVLSISGLQAHVAVIHFVDHLPYYRIEHMNARSKVHTPRSTLAG